MRDREQSVRDHAKQLSLKSFGQLDQDYIDTLTDGVLDAWHWYSVGDAAGQGKFGLTRIYNDDGSPAVTYRETALDSIITHGERLLAAMRKVSLFGYRFEHGRDIDDFANVQSIVDLARAVRDSSKRGAGNPRNLAQHGLVRQFAHVYAELNGKVPSYRNQRFVAWLNDWCGVLELEKPSEYIRGQAIRALKKHGPLGQRYLKRSPFSD